MQDQVRRSHGWWDTETLVRHIQYIATSNQSVVLHDWHLQRPGEELCKSCHMGDNLAGQCCYTEKKHPNNLQSIPLGTDNFFACFGFSFISASIWSISVFSSCFWLNIYSLAIPCCLFFFSVLSHKSSALSSQNKVKVLFIRSSILPLTLAAICCRACFLMDCLLAVAKASLATELATGRGFIRRKYRKQDFGGWPVRFTSLRDEIN